jgi:hypothetical protein
LWSETSVNHRLRGPGVQDDGHTTLHICFRTVVSEAFAGRGGDSLESKLLVKTIGKLFFFAFFVSLPLRQCAQSALMLQWL